MSKDSQIKLPFVRNFLDLKLPCKPFERLGVESARQRSEGKWRLELL